MNPSNTMVIQPLIYESIKHLRHPAIYRVGGQREAFTIRRAVRRASRRRVECDYAWHSSCHAAESIASAEQIFEGLLDLLSAGHRRKRRFFDETLRITAKIHARGLPDGQNSTSM